VFCKLGKGTESRSRLNYQAVPGQAPRKGGKKKARRVWDRGNWGESRQAGPGRRTGEGAITVPFGVLGRSRVKKGNGNTFWSNAAGGTGGAGDAGFTRIFVESEDGHPACLPLTS